MRLEHDAPQISVDGLATAPRVPGDEGVGRRQRTPRGAIQSRAKHEPSAGEPFFTIAIPTKNRPDQLRNAIQSTLQQTFSDFEVVVCDNSDEPQSAETAAVVRDLADPRIRYVRTNGRLSMADNWDRAIAEARGRFVGILTDRSVFRRDALQVARTEIDITGAKVLVWANDLYGRDPEGTVYKRRPSTFKRFLHTPDAILDYFLHGHPKYSSKVIPKLLAGVCDRAILDAIRSTTSRVCFPVSPDYTSGFLVLAHCDQVLSIDASLYVSCGTGNGSNFRQRGELADRFRADLGLEWRDMVDRMPSEACFSTGTVLNDFLRVRELVPDRLGHLELDKFQYYLGCLFDYIKTSRHGVLRSEDFQVLLHALEQESPDVRDKVRATRYFEGAINLELMPTLDEETKDHTIAADEPLRFDTVFDAMAWDEANPRTPASSTYLDLTIRLAHVAKSRSAKISEREDENKQRRALKWSQNRELKAKQNWERKVQQHELKANQNREEKARLYELKTNQKREEKARQRELKSSRKRDLKAKQRVPKETRRRDSRTTTARELRRRSVRFLRRAMPFFLGKTDRP